MSEFHKKYLAESAEFNEKIKQLNERRSKINAELERLKKKLKKVEKEIDEVPYVGTYRLIECLADELSKILGLEYKIYGPFGINCETSIYFMKECGDICSVPTVCIHLRPFKRGDEDWLSYWTGEVTHNYHPDSIGFLNNCHHVYAPLPEETEKILEILAPKIQHFNAEWCLREQAEEKNAAHYTIVEDSYEYENGLCLIIYKDDEEVVETEHTCVNINDFEDKHILERFKSFKNKE